jgi:hypothetical protein
MVVAEAATGITVDFNLIDKIWLDNLCTEHKILKLYHISLGNYSHESTDDEYISFSLFL